MEEQLTQLGYREIHFLYQYGDVATMYSANLLEEQPHCLLLKIVFESYYKESLEEKIHRLMSFTQQYPEEMLSYQKVTFLEETFKAQNTAVIQMEQCEALEKEASRQLKLVDIYELGISLCRALLICHHNGIIHGNLNETCVFKENICLNNRISTQMGETYTHYKLGGFGIDRLPVDEHYMPPEWFNRRRADEKTDIYSLGILLYKLLNRGQYPVYYKGQEDEEAEQQRCNRENIPFPEFGNISLKKLICEEALNPDPQKRLDILEFGKKLIFIKQSIQNQTWLQSSIEIKPDDSQCVDWRLYQDTEIPNRLIIEDTAEGVEETAEKEIKKSKKKWKGRSEKSEEKEKKKKEKENRKRIKQTLKKGEKKRNNIKEKKGILAIISVAVILLAGISVFVLYLTEKNYADIYSEIRSGSLSVALKEIEKAANSGSNVDEIAGAYLDACMSAEEYKRIPDIIPYFSEEYCREHIEDFENMVGSILQRGKKDRAKKILEVMERSGENMKLCAEKIYRDYGEELLEE